MKLSQEARERFMLDYIDHWREKCDSTYYEGAIEWLQEFEAALKDKFNDENPKSRLSHEELKENICIDEVKCVCGDCCKKPNVYLSDEEKKMLKIAFEALFETNTSVSLEIEECKYNTLLEKLS